MPKCLCERWARSKQARGIVPPIRRTLHRACLCLGHLNYCREMDGSEGVSRGRVAVRASSSPGSKVRKLIRSQAQRRYAVTLRCYAGSIERRLNSIVALRNWLLFPTLKHLKEFVICGHAHPRKGRFARTLRTGEQCPVHLVKHSLVLSDQGNEARSVRFDGVSFGAVTGVKDQGEVTSNAVSVMGSHARRSPCPLVKTARRDAFAHHLPDST